ncbi:S41 family peptidase [Hyphomicrobium sulfonivorans]|uniref:S41 family peptidase n=1 Tax=Hyphomicrobium sulfonivorans TaxID=121290 RepID=UPI00156F2007|nr:S41 family peptidase [Hyphomicrobium sulfonivorans]MBI1649789.1 carboxyl-terminal protease [Hyphomicrobium sulfonivorans]NSL71703.1 peptidase S41 [Hyphomicrobium sulfonivorans]
MRATAFVRSGALAVAMAGAQVLPLPLAEARPVSRTAQETTAVYDEVWRLVRDRFYDAKLLGLDWDSLGEKHRATYAAANSDAQRSAAINALLGELGVSHTRHYTPDETAYYELADIFRYPLRRELPKHFTDGTVRYTGIGMFTREIDGKTFISAVFPNMGADRAGLLAGDEIIAADGQPFEAVGSFRDKVGKKVELEIRRTSNGDTQKISVEPHAIEPGKAFHTALRSSARIIEHNGKSIGYVRVWSYAGGNYHETLENVLSEGRLKDADALIWDLRDGWGGAQPSYLNVFNPHGPTLTLKGRTGAERIVDFRWNRPVTMLVNGGTRSGKEVLAYGFKKNKFGEVVGETTAGALLAGTSFMLSDGSLLILAVQDAEVDGERLEGKGVAPSVEVPFDVRYAAGKDPQLDRALEVLSGSM